MTLADEIDLDREYARVSREHRAQRVQHWRERFAAPEGLPLPKARVVAPSEPAAVKIPMLFKCLDCPTMIARPRLRCESCARAKKVEQNRTARHIVRVDKAAEVQQNETGG